MLPGCFIEDPRSHMSMSTDKPGPVLVRVYRFMAFSQLYAAPHLLTILCGKRVYSLWKYGIDSSLNTAYYYYSASQHCSLTRLSLWAT